jgi:HK97 family phage major capsid protein
MKTQSELLGEIGAKRAIIGKAFNEAGKEYDFDLVTCLQGKTTEEKMAEIETLNKQISELHDQYVKVSKLAELRKANDEALGADVHKSNPASEVKTLGGIIMDRKAELLSGRRVMLDIDPKSHFGLETKANFFTTAGWAPAVTRQPGYVESPTRKLGVIDMIPVFPTVGNSVYYMLETTFTNAAAEKTEGNAAAESALALTETSRAVQEVATFVPTSKVQLEDAPLAEAYLNSRLGFMVRQKLESQALEGDGNAPNLLGTLHLAALQAQALGADSRADAIYKAFDLIRTVGFAEPSALFINPADWQPVRLSQTADGVYLFGNPADGDMNRIWGVPVIQTTAVTANTALCGDYANFSYIAMRRGLEIEMSSGYDDYFVKGKLAVLASLRCAVVHTRITAFAKITGI